MAQPVARLGSDGIDFWHDEHAGLAHCHRWTTPEEVGEKQPLIDSRSGTVLCLDGRLDNRADLLARLHRAGAHVSADESDAALLLAAWGRWGPDLLEHLLGDFAVVIYEAARRRLICARDALSRRNLFYHSNADRFLCATMLRQLFCDPSTPRKLCRHAVARYLVAEHPQPGETFFDHVFRVPTGHWLEVTDGGKIALHRSWFPENIALVEGKPAQWYSETFRECFLAAVRARLRTTSNSVALHVSGGVDSSLVVAASHHLIEQEGLKLSTWAMQNIAQYPAADERCYMKEVIARYPMPVVTTATEDYWAGRQDPLVDQWQDEPWESDYGARLVAELQVARQRGTRLILGGSGGDEVGGNSWYLVDRLFRGRVRGLLYELAVRAKGRGVSTAALLKTLATALLGWVYRSLLPVPQRVPPWIDRRLAAQAGLLRRKRAGSTFGHPARNDMLSRLQVFWRSPAFAAAEPICDFLGVQLCDPFVDRRVFEWALSVPPFRFGEQGLVKWPLRSAFAEMLPEAVLHRADKGSYLYYWDLGLRVKERPRILALFHKPISQELGFVELSRLRKAYDDYCRGKQIDRRLLWNWITLEKWLRHIYASSANDPHQ